jgi:catechol 2,3-dioxygenase-like lactoylglutathione lyase family enzyme
LLRGSGQRGEAGGTEDRAPVAAHGKQRQLGRVGAEWSAKGAEFLTEPKDHGREIRAYIRDPDGHLIEVGQTTAAPGPA